MMQGKLIITTIFVLISFAECHIYCVKPTDDSTCPEFSCPYHTLTFYVRNSTQYFTSNTTLIFLNGSHEIGIGEFIVIKDVNNLALVGSQSPATVVCTESTGFAFLGITNLTISNMAFMYCGCAINNSLLQEVTEVYSKLHQIYNQFRNDTYVALLMAEIHFLTIIDTSVQNSTGYGLLAINILGNSSLRDSRFLFNNYHTLPDPKNVRSYKAKILPSCQGGGAIFFFAELANCSNAFQQNMLDIVSTMFWFGADLLCNSHSLPKNRFVVSGSGIGLAIGPVSYGITVNLRDVVSAENNRVAGANIYIALYDYITNYSVQISNTSSIHGNTGLHHSNIDDELWIEEGIGLLFVYGLPLAQNFVRECPGHPDQGTLKGSVEILNSHFNENYGKLGAGASIQLDPLPYLEYDFSLMIAMRNCTFNDNTAGVGAFGASLTILQYNRHLGRSPFTIVIQNSSFSNTQWQKQFFIPVPDIALFGLMSTIFLSSVKNLTFVNCSFVNNTNTAMLAMDTILYFEGNITFSENTGYFGGGLALRDDSIMYLKSNTHVHFINNYARHRGGGMYLTAIDVSSTRPCFYQVYQRDRSTNPNVKLIFINNTAEEAGDALFGGAAINNCVMQNTSTYNDTEPDVVFNSLFNITDFNPIRSISSMPQRPCFCAHGVQDCIGVLDHKSISVYPGQRFQKEFTVVGLENGAVPGTIHTVFLPNSNAHLGPLQEAQLVGRGCQNLTFNVYSSSSYEMLRFTVEYLDTIEQNSTFTILHVYVRKCPPGFQLSDDECICAAPFQNLNVTCDINDGTVNRSGLLWVHLQQNVANESDVIVHQHCPFDYCKPETVKISLNHSDEQCAFNRSGVLCGGCREGLSATFGGSQCMKCSNVYVGFLAGFVAAGILLTAMLIACNLTISVGTLNGLIFYANIVRVNESTFFPSTTNTFTNILIIFLAWVNLDLGIESCFYSGMDVYWKTALQFVFPVYVWTIVGILIVLSRRFSRVARLVGRHAVQVLATLLLLSYAKLERTIITILSSTSLDLGYGNSHSVWLYDGNVHFLKGRHIALFVLAIGFTLFFIIPFTLVVLCAPCLQALRCQLLPRFILRLKPLLDAYMGPYRTSFRCWTGVMLVIRTGLFIAFALNTSGDPNINLAVIITVVGSLLAVCCNTGPVYKLQRVQLLGIRWSTRDGKVPISLLNFIEISFILNLLILSVWTLINRSGVTDSTVNQNNVATVSATVAALTFVFVACYHFWVYAVKSCHRKLKRCWDDSSGMSSINANPQEQCDLRQHSDDDSDSNADVAQHEPTVTFIPRPTPTKPMSANVNISLKDPCRNTRSQTSQSQRNKSQDEKSREPAAQDVSTELESSSQTTSSPQLREPLDLLTDESSRQPSAAAQDASITREPKSSANLPHAVNYTQYREPLDLLTDDSLQ